MNNLHQATWQTYTDAWKVSTEAIFVQTVSVAGMCLPGPSCSSGRLGLTRKLYVGISHNDSRRI